MATRDRRRRPHSPETRAKMSAALKGHEVSPETRAKMSAASKGRPGHPPVSYTHLTLPTKA